uniref:Facilitated trehalose transporter Tret1 n=1 Tax=Cacopsylla melanoneura TaxID=428564 RepID=A0A8D8UXV6_9HEMI
MDGQKEELGEYEDQTGRKVQYGFRSACSQVTASVAQNFLLFSLGMSFGMPTVVVGVLDHKVATNLTLLETPELILSDEESSWLGSILFLFHPFGAVISGYLLEYVGRKRLMMAVGIPFFIGWLSLYLAQSVTFIMVGTICMGLGVGCCEAPIISYIGEISEPRMRGSLSLFAGAACNFGVLIIFLIYALTDWRSTMLVSSIFPILTMIMIAFIPESPTWLVSKGRLEEAERSLRWVRGWSKKHKVQVEFDQLVKETKSATLYEPDHEMGQYLTNKKTQSSQFTQVCNYLIRPEILRPFNMIMILFFITIIASLQPMRPFLVEIFRTFGLPMKSEWVLVLTGILSITGSFVSTITVNKFGKRGMSLWSTAINTGFTLALSVCAMNLHWPGWVPLTIFCICFWVSGYGMLPLPWMLLSEVYPLQVRGVASGITAATSSIVNFVATKTYINLTSWFGLHGTLFIYTSVSLLGFVYIYFYVPETEDRTLQEIMDFFGDSKRARDFKPSKENQSLKNSLVQ